MTTTFAADAERLGLAARDVTELVELRRGGDCAPVHRRMAELVAARLAEVQAELSGALTDQAAAGGVGVATGVEPLSRGIPLARTGGRLQAAAEILAGPPRFGECAGDCACSRAAAVTGGPYAFPIASRSTAEGIPIACTLDADGGDLVGRLGEWQAMLAGATGREEIDGGIAVTFDHDIARTAELARLLAAEYSCCSFASYQLTIDARGVRMEVRTPPEARDALSAVFGTG
jgi:hypothetical protein